MALIKKLFTAENTLFLIYASITFIMVWFHEPWRDESQKWLIARDNNFWGVIEMAAYEGHPALWTMLVFPLATLGFSIFSMQVLNWVIMCTAIWIFIKNAPFNIYIKYVFCLSYFMMFEYCVIARNYCLVMLGLVLIASFYKTRKQNIVPYALSLFLLTQSHVLVIGVVLALLFLQLLEFKEFSIKKHLIFFVIVLAGVLLLFLQVKRPPDSIFPLMLENIEIDLIKNYIFDFIASIMYVISPLPINWIGSIFILLLLIFLLEIEFKFIAIFFISVLPIIIVGSSIYDLARWHFLLSFIYFIIVIWINKIETLNLNFSFKQQKKISLGGCVLFIILFISAYVNLRYIELEINQPFSDGKESAEIIQNKNYSKTHFIIGHDTFIPPVLLPYFPNLKLYYPAYSEYGSFAKWRFPEGFKISINSKNSSYKKLFKDGKNLPFQVFMSRIRKEFSSDDKVLLLFAKQNFPLDSIHFYHLKIIDSSQSNGFYIKDESFYFVEI